MADPMFGQKCEENVKEGLTTFMNNHGYTGKEFMAHLLELCELEASSRDVPELNQDLLELTTISTRIVDIYKNLCARVENLTSAKLQEYEKVIANKDETIATMGDFVNEKVGQTNELSEEIKRLEAEFEKSVNERDGLLTRVNELTDVIKKNEEFVETNKALVAEYKEKNDLLLGKMKDADAALKEKDSLLAKNKELEIARTQAMMELDVVKADAEHMKDQHNTNVERLNKEHTEDIKLLNEKNELYTNRKLLEQEQKFQKTINELHNDYNAKVRGLLDELEKKNATTPKETKDPAKKKGLLGNKKEEE